MKAQNRLPQLLETARLRLRLITPEDAPALNAAIVDSFEHLQPWMPWAKERPGLADTEAFCLEAVTRCQSGSGLDLLMEDAGTGELIGASGYPRLDWQVPSFEIGYWCRCDQTGRGYVSEAVWALADHAFSALSAARVELVIDTANTASIAVARRLGFQQEAVLRNHDRNNADQLSDTGVYALISRAELKSFQPR